MNNNFMRQGGQGQGNRNRNRNRSRHRTSGGGSSSGNNNGGGHSSNKVFDSNGPDVKLRGTAQTVAEKYMQLGRDAQSSGDSVSAESYYQHAEHYYRVWASNQPVGASLIMSRKLGEEEFEEDGEGGDDETPDSQTPVSEGAAAAEGGEGAIAPPAEGQDEQQRPSQNNNRNGRERFRPRWQQRRDRNPEGAPDQAQSTHQQDGATSTPVVAEHIAEDNGQWEAPSFLQRPVPAPVSEPMAEEESVEAPRKSRPRRERAEPVILDEVPPKTE